MTQSPGFDAGSRAGRQMVACGDALQAAATNGALRPAFQPIVSLATGSIIGFEVLAWWQDTENSNITASSLASIAEDRGVVWHLPDCVIEEACTVASRWSGDFFLSLNISALQLIDTHFCERLCGVICRTSFPLSRVRLEIAERHIVSNLGAARKFMCMLKQNGISITLNGFGAGFSDLSLLKALPFDGLQIDKGFVHPATKTPRDRKILNTIIDLGHRLNMSVIAEGIETAEEVSMLAELGCDWGQGYHLGRPAHVDAVPELLAASKRQLCPVQIEPSFSSRFAYFDATYRDAPFGFCFVDKANRIVDANRGFLDIIGIHEMDVNGVALDDLPNSFPSSVVCNYGIAKHCKSTANTGRIDLLNNRAIFTHISVARDANGESVGLSIVMLDLSTYGPPVVIHRFGKRTGLQAGIALNM